MRSLPTIPHRRVTPLRPLLVVGAAALVGGACSSSNSGNTTGASATQAATIVDDILTTTNGFITRFSAGASTGITRFRPEGTGTGTYPCAVSGSATVTLTTAGEQLSYASCNEGTFAIDGALAVSCVATGVGSTEVTSEGLNGTLAVTLYSSSGAVTEATDVTFDDYSVVIPASGGPAVQVGSVTVGGTTFTNLALGSTLAALACSGSSDDAGTSSDDGGLCGTSAGTCSIAVCPAGTSCAGSGLSAASYPCTTVVAQYDSASGATSIPISNCLDDTDPPIVAINLTGTPTTGTFPSTNAVVADTAIVCAGSLSGTYWGASTDGAEDGGALGSFSLTLTSVTLVPNAPGGTTAAYLVHGSLQATCVGGPTEDGGPTASGTVSMTVAF